MEFNIETAVRICPTNDMVCVQANTANNTIQLGNSQNYPVNYVLPSNCCQSTVFTTAVTPLVTYLVEGCDVSIVTLGQTGTGKSYTLLGPGFHCASSESEHGIIPRFIREIFTKMKQYRDRNWSVHVTWSQICGDNVQDLLGVGSIECSNITDVFQLLQLGMSNIAPKCAHTLFTLTLEQQWIVDTTVQHRVSTASFADLAGSEKVLVYDSNGMMQTIPTDLGLQTLQRCIMSLSDCNNQYFVPYSQSVLTTLLKDSFGGRAKTLLLCCISPLVQHFTETLYTLQIAMRAQLIKNYVTVNSYTTVEEQNCDIFGLQFATNQLFKLVTNAEELFQRLVSNEFLPKTEQELITQWLTLKQECEDCLSENSEPHRSLERIEEESSESEEEEKEILDKVDRLIKDFRVKTDKLISNTNTVHTVTSFTKSVNSSNTEFHIKGARGRRGSIHSTEDFNPILSLNNSKISEDDEREETVEVTKLSYETKKKVLKQVVTALELNQKKITDLEKTIRVKENLMQSFLRHKDTKSSAHNKLEQQCQVLRKEYKNLEAKLVQARHDKNVNLEVKLKSDKTSLEEKLHDAESLKSLTEDGNKLLELENDLYTSKKQLEKLKKYKQQKEKYRSLYEKQLREEKLKLSNKSCDSFDKKTPDKVVALLRKSQHSTLLNSEDLECLRHEIRNLRKTRDYLLDMRCKIDVQSQNQKILNENEERKLLQYEEAVEAIDLIMEYKNSILCGHHPLQDLEEQSDRMLMERFLKLSENEMRILLHKYFEKIIDLRSSGKKLEMQILDIENKHEKLAYYVLNLRHNLQLERSDAERRITSLQQQHEDKLYKVLRNLTENNDNERISRVMGSRHAAVTFQVGNASNQVDRNRLITRITRYRQETVPKQIQAAHDTKVTIEKNKNKIILQKTNKN